MQPVPLLDEVAGLFEGVEYGIPWGLDFVRAFVGGQQGFSGFPHGLGIPGLGKAGAQFLDGLQLLQPRLVTGFQHFAASLQLGVKAVQMLLQRIALCLLGKVCSLDGLPGLSADCQQSIHVLGIGQRCGG